MKQKLIHALLCFALLPCLMGTASAAVSEIKIPTGQEEEGIIPREIAQEYLDILQDYTREYGTSTGTSAGLSYARLIDFNGDGSYELYVICAKSIYENADYVRNEGTIATLEVVEEVWAVRNGQVQLVRSEKEIGGLQGGSYIGTYTISRKLAYSNGETFLLKSYNDTIPQLYLESEITATETLFAFDGYGFVQKEDLYFHQKDAATDMLYTATRNGESAYDATNFIRSMTQLYEQAIKNPYQITWEEEILSNDYNGSLRWQSQSCLAELQAIIDTPSSDYYGYEGVFNNAPLLAQITVDVGSDLGGDILALFEVLPDFYYAVVDGGGKQISHLIYQGTEGGDSKYAILYSAQENMEVQTLWAQISLFQNNANVAVDYSPLGTFTTVQEYADHLTAILSQISGTEVNDHSKREITQYLQLALSQTGSSFAYAKDNRLNIRGSHITASVARMTELEGLFQGVLSAQSLTLNKEVEQTLQIFAQNLSEKEEMSITFHATLLEQLSPDMNLKVMIEGSALAFSFSYEDLQALLTKYDNFTLLINSSDGKVFDLSFQDVVGGALDRIPASLTLMLPSDSPLNGIYAQTSQTDGENWGGQYDENQGTLSIVTSFAGSYEVQDTSAVIMDLADNSHGDIIEFMVSKGFFTLEKDNFYPDNPLSRYAFSVALVGMFYAMDRDLTTSFTDVPEDSFYYAYVASAQAKNLISGMTENSYMGDEYISQEQVLSIIARTLVEERGYAYPTDVSEYLTFSGGDQVSEWAQEAAALCFREGIILRGEHLSPTAEITRSQGAVYLYRLMMRLYETSPVTITVPQEESTALTEEELMIITASVAVIWTVVLGLLTLGIKKGIKKRKQAKLLAKGG